MLHIMDVITDKPGWEEKVYLASFRRSWSFSNDFAG